MTKREESLAGGVRRTAPKCKDCGGSSPRVVCRHDSTGALWYEWLCAVCEYKRAHPDEPPRPKLPS